MKPTAEQERLLRIVTDRKADEDAAIERAEEEHRVRLAAIRADTNAAVHAAWMARIPKAQINTALGTKSPIAADRRLRWHAGVSTEAAPQVTDTEDVAVTVQATPSVTATADDTGYTVDLHRFTHPDVGENVSGRVVFDLDGDLKISDIPEVSNDELVALKLWATKEVQDAVANA